MPTETLHFQYDPMELAKQLLIIYFESKLKAFDTSLLSHGNYEIKYETPVFICEAVYDALDNMSEDTRYLANLLFYLALAGYNLMLGIYFKSHKK